MAIFAHIAKRDDELPRSLQPKSSEMGFFSCLPTGPWQGEACGGMYFCAMLVRFLGLEEIPESRDVPVYGSAVWLDAVRTGVPYALKILGLEDSGRIVAWHPYFEVKRGPWRRALPMFVDTVGGPYYLPPVELVFAERSRWLREAQSALFAALAREVDFATLCPLDSDPRALPVVGDWKTIVRATARLDLNLENPPWSSQALRKLRKGGNKGLQIVRNQPMRHFSAAVEAVLARHPRAFLPGPQMEFLRSELQSRGVLDSWCVLGPDGAEVAYGLVALDAAQDAALFWANINTPEGLKLYASDFLFHGVAQAYRGRLRWFDLCGTDDANLIDFKEKWASETRYAFAYDYARRPWMRTALALFSRLRK